jgi:hypothetical protein
MAGLDPAIHGITASTDGYNKGVDARHKAGHDENTKSGSPGTMGISLRTHIVYHPGRANPQVKPAD